MTQDKAQSQIEEKDNKKKSTTKTKMNNTYILYPGVNTCSHEG